MSGLIILHQGWVGGWGGGEWRAQDYPSKPVLVHHSINHAINNCQTNQNAHGILQDHQSREGHYIRAGGEGVPPTPKYFPKRLYIYIYIYSRRRTRWTWVVVTQSFTRYAIIRQLVSDDRITRETLSNNNPCPSSPSSTILRSAYMALNTLQQDWLL